MSSEKKCGCKGIRTCLLCEEQKDAPANSHQNNEDQFVYMYCPQCNLCWPEDEMTAAFCNFPLYVGKIKLIPEFISEEEEALAISCIDEIPWMPSQSGRRKQDFGPKVNFKKKKVKIGDFKGFPRFTENVSKKFKDVPELLDFYPVELCHLEYTPERGSSIDPHLDDFWLWGERLVTINLNSSTILTLVPCSEDPCECLAEAVSDFPSFSFRYNSRICNHKFQDLSKNISMKSSVNELSASGNSYILSVDSREIAKPLDLSSISTDALPSQVLTSNVSLNNSQLFREQVDNENYQVSVDNLNASSEILKASLNNINTMCSIFRFGEVNAKVCVKIVLPPRSLFILAGCARYKWFHEIRRKDVYSRRLAMTFRELSQNFLDGGSECHVGEDLLQTANNFYDV